MSKKLGKRLGLLALCAAVCLSAFTPATAQSETVIRAAGPWPKTHPLTQSFLRFTDKANAAGKGVFQINYIGGPEITSPREQPAAMRNGLFDMLYGPPAYYLGIFPEGDFAYGFKRATEQRANGAYELINQAMKKKMNARFLARFDSGEGLYLFLKDEPKRTSSGGVDLTGLKVRASPGYRDFIQDLGGTAVIMAPDDVYTALQRGVIDGAGFSLNDIRTRGTDKMLRYWIDPPFSYATISLIMNLDAWNKLSPKGQKLLDDLATAWEQESYQYWIDAAEREKVELKKVGMQAIELSEKAAREYQALFLKGPWQRMKNNPRITIDFEKLKEAAY